MVWKRRKRRVTCGYCIAWLTIYDLKDRCTSFGTTNGCRFRHDREWVRTDYYQWPHHVVLFVLQDVAVPDVLIPVNIVPCARVNGEGHLRQVKLHDHRGHFSRVHPDGLLPANFVGIRESFCPRCGGKSRRRCIERRPLDDLDVHQVEVDWMGVTGEVVDIPDFQRANVGILCGPHRGKRVPRLAIPGYSTHLCGRPLQLDQSAIVVEVLV